MRVCLRIVLVMTVAFFLAWPITPWHAAFLLLAEEAPSTVDYTGVEVEKDIPYLSPGRVEKLDLYRPAARDKGTKYPGIVIIHGGSWRGGEKNGPIELDFATTLARAGYICASIDYVLSREGHPAWPQILYDCKSAVQFLRKFARRYQVDSQAIGVIGSSAGGHLALMVGLTSGDPALEPAGPYRRVSSRVQAAVSFYGPTNLLKWHGGLESCELLVGVLQQQDLALWELASPVNHVSAGAPPIFLIHGSEDKGIPVSQAQELDALLQERGVPHDLVIVQGAPHAFSLRWRQLDLRPQVIGFFDQHLKGKR